jgi:NAD(P)-dependent dehydrogenase (short-subunit alcohol dehydrogenase family)
MKNEKIAIITGSSSGIGKATAILLSQQGYKICVNYNKN